MQLVPYLRANEGIACAGADSAAARNTASIPKRRMGRLLEK
jgi:hypothetical protein